MPPQGYSGPDNANASVSGSCIDRAGNTGVRTSGSAMTRPGPSSPPPLARARLERLVQPRALRQLHRHRRDLGHGLLRPAPELQRPRQRQRVGVRLLPRSSREHDRARVRAQLRRDRARRHRHPGPRPRLERLVQPRADGDLQRHRRHVRRRELRPAADLLRARRRERLGQRLLPRPGRERHRPRVRAQLRRDGAVVTATPARAPDSNGWYNHSLAVSFSGTDGTSGIESCVPPQNYSGPDDADASVSGSCRDRAGTRPSAASRSATTRPRRR